MNQKHRLPARLLIASALLLLLPGCGPDVREEQQVKYPPLSNLQPIAGPTGYASNLDQRAELGRMLFFDKRLSTSQQTSCASCHNPEKGFSGKGDVGWRDVPGLVNSRYQSSLGWDGSSSSLEQQAEQHAADALVLNANAQIIEARLALIPEYRRQFQMLFHSAEPQADQVWQAIATFERSLVQSNTPFDRYIQGDRDALDKQQRAGMELFYEKANCIHCHNGPLGSDGNYHNLGLATVDLLRVSAEQQIAFRYRQRLKGLSGEAANTTRADLGRWYISHQETDKGAFRTPTLRELRHTAPYMHNGTLSTLEEVVEFYDRGGADPAGRTTAHQAYRSPLIKPLGLDAKEKAALVAFLNSMSGPLMRIKLPDLPKSSDPMVKKPVPVRQRSLREQLTPRLYLTDPDPEPREPPSRLPADAGSLYSPNRVLSRDKTNQGN